LLCFGALLLPAVHLGGVLELLHLLALARGWYWRQLGAWRRRATVDTNTKDQHPAPPQDNNDPRKSYSFSGIQNTSRQGTPVPIVYGETLVGSVVISAGIDTVQVTG
jgi:hypothetical protein